MDTPVTPRRYLLMKSSMDRTTNILWLDSVGTCRHEDASGSVYHSRYHFSRDSKGLARVLLCPNGLERSEWARVFVDDPPGSWTSNFSDYAQGPPKRTAVEEGA